MTRGRRMSCRHACGSCHWRRGSGQRRQPRSRDEEPAEISTFAFFQEAAEEEPAARLFKRLYRLLPIRLCRSTLAECAGDWLAAHWRLRQHVAALLAISLPPERPEYEAHVDACWEEGRSAEQQQLSKLQLEEDGLLRRREAAVRQGRRPAIQQADQQMAELQPQRCSRASRRRRAMPSCSASTSGAFLLRQWMCTPSGPPMTSEL